MGRGAQGDVGVTGTVTEPKWAERQVTVIRGEVYDITDFLDKHPGGRQLINLACRRDATVMFESYHINSDITDKWLARLPKVEGVTVVDLAKGVAGPFDCPCGDREIIQADGKDVASVVDTFATPRNSELYTVLKNRIKNEVMSKRGMTSARGSNVINTLAVMAYYCLSLYCYLVYPSVLSAIMLGLAGAWVGFGVQHTANHGGLTPITWLNQILGLGDDIACGGSSLVWRYHHQVSHHVYTNVLDKDMDVYSSFPLMRFDDRQPKQWFHAYQWIYAPISFSFLYWSIQFQDFMSMQQRTVMDVRMLGLQQREVNEFYAGKAMHFVVSIVIPLMTQPLTQALWYWFLYVGVGSAVLAWFFIVSHNIEEAKPTAIPKEAEKDWARWQIETSATWGRQIACFMTGGLNYQIEHHLFPGMSHSLYPEIQPIIMEECKKRDIPYHDYDLMGISKAMINFLHSMGVKETVKMD